MNGWVFVWKYVKMEGCLDGWVNGNNFFHSKLTWFSNYTHRHTTRTGEREDINAIIYWTIFRENWGTSEHNTAVDLTELELTGLICLRIGSSSNRFWTRWQNLSIMQTFWQIMLMSFYDIPLNAVSLKATGCSQLNTYGIYGSLPQRYYGIADGRQCRNRLVCKT